ncbi:hypothetical protein [Kitasatospora sp. NPDC059571]|uniref:hypothetical protein n=1 Tax=Kitasatospora sp. NPDC059571 TaxID=3346871 RepID=UPI0036B1DF4B
MRVRKSMAAAAAVAALAAVAGCGTGDGGAPSAGRPAPPPTAAPASCAPRLADGDEGPGGESAEPSVEDLPDEVRCLPSVAYGSVVVQTGNAALPHRSLMVTVVQGTGRMQTQVLCGKLTELGYGPGGRRGIDMLTVGGDPASGTYLSGPTTRGRTCVQAP